jgi:hypothetical protein
VERLTELANRVRVDVEATFPAGESEALAAFIAGGEELIQALRPTLVRMRQLAKKNGDDPDHETRARDAEILRCAVLELQHRVHEAKRRRGGDWIVHSRFPRPGPAEMERARRESREVAERAAAAVQELATRWREEEAIPMEVSRQVKNVRYDRAGDTLRVHVEGELPPPLSAMVDAELTVDDQGHLVRVRLASSSPIDLVLGEARGATRSLSARVMPMPGGQVLVTGAAKRVRGAEASPYVPWSVF